jgi:hypothetical protein
MKLAAAAIAGALFVATHSAHAQSGAMFGETSRAASLADAMTARGGDPAAITMNPGALAAVDEPLVTLGAHGGRLGLRFTRDGEPPSELGRSVAGFGAALATPLFAPLDMLHFGIGAHVPAQHALRLRAPSRSDEPSFPLYGGRAERTAIAASLAWRVFGRIGIGAGVMLTPRLFTPTVVGYVPGRGATSSDKVTVDLERELRIAAAPTLGVWARVHRFVALGLASRGAVTTGAEGPNDTRAGTLVIADRIDIRDFLEPEEVALGAAVYPRAGTSVSLDAVLARWSRYRTADDRTSDPPLSDVIDVRAGLEQRLAVAVALRVGYAFEPTPVPRQKAATNLLDGTRHVLALGLGWDLRRQGWAPVCLDGHFRAHVLHRASASKDPAALGDADPQAPGQQIANLGFPSFTATGYAVESGFTLTVYAGRRAQ